MSPPEFFKMACSEYFPQIFLVFLRVSAPFSAKICGNCSTSAFIKNSGGLMFCEEMKFMRIDAFRH